MHRGTRSKKKLYIYTCDMRRRAVCEKQWDCVCAPHRMHRLLYFCPYGRVYEFRMQKGDSVFMITHNIAVTYIHYTHNAALRTRCPSARAMYTQTHTHGIFVLRNKWSQPKKRFEDEKEQCDILDMCHSFRIFFWCVYALRMCFLDVGLDFHNADCVYGHGQHVCT